MAVLTTMKLESFAFYAGDPVGQLSIQSFVGSYISQTLVEFIFYMFVDTIPVLDDVQVATALACCHNLKKLDVYFEGSGPCTFGRGGLDGLQAMATGCPLLRDASISLTVPGIHYLGTHFTNLKKCEVYDKLQEGFPTVKELHTLYPAVKWK
jgi:hypothetical protein